MNEPELLPPARPYDDGLAHKIARSASIQAIARIGMILVSAMFPILLTLLALIGNRVITTMDKIADKQDAQAQQIATITAEIGMLKLRDMQIDNRVTETNGTINLRIDAVSQWNRTNAEAIDKLKEHLYPLLQPRR